jgi:uncharacterized integral membrane protein (TIGR00698 family)
MTLTTNPTPVAVHTERRPAQRRWTTVLIGLLIVAVGYGAATLGHRLVPQVGVLTWAVGLGMIAANLKLIPAVGKRALGLVTKRLLRVGIVLLGFAVSFHAIAALGLNTIAVVAVALASTLIFTTWLGRRLGLSRSRSLIIATGFAICGASAIAAMEDTAEADEEDVTAGIAMVTLFGTIAMIALPLLAGPLGLTHLQFGVWSGASIQEVGQVVAAAGPAGAAVLAVAVVVKLTRVLMLAPAVATVSIAKRMKSPAANSDAKRPPLVPLFVIGFVACAALRSVGAMPAAVLPHIATVQVAALGAALFGMGASVQLSSLLKGSGRVIVLAAISTVFIAAVSLAGILLIAH